MTSKAVNPASVAFDGTLAAFGNNTGIVVAPELIEELGAGKRPPVLVNVNGYEFRNTVAVMGGRHLISVSAAVRSATGLAGGDAIRVILTIADEPRPVEVPTDFAMALQTSEPAREFFDRLSNSLQRFHIDTINAAKSPETRHRRINKAVELFLAGKKR